MGILKQQKEGQPLHKSSYFTKFSATLLLAGAIFLSSCGRVEPQPTYEIVKPNKRQERIMVDFKLPEMTFPPMHAFKRDGFVLMVEKDSLFEKANRLASIIEEYQALMPENSRPRLVMVANYFGANKIDSELVSMAMRKKDGNAIFARGDAPAFGSEERLRRSVFHELCHLYMDNNIDSVENIPMENAYLSIMRLAKLPAYPDSVHSSIVDANPLFGPFNESTFLKGTGTGYGAPEWGDWEVFASGSTNLFFDDVKLFQRLERLKKQNRKFYQADYDGLRTIVSLWKGIPLFKGGVYSKLSLAKPEEK